MGLPVLLGQFGKLTKMLGLLLGQTVRNFDNHTYQLIAPASATDVREAFSLQAEDLVRLCPSWDLHFDLAVEGGNVNLRTECRMDESDRSITQNFCALALEKVMVHDLDHDIQIARRSTVLAGFAFIGEFQPLSGIDPGRDRDFELGGFLRLSLALTGSAR